MANFQERFGREGIDKPSLTEEVPILGHRIVETQTKGMLPAHTLKYFQLVYVEQGEIEVWVNDRFYTVREQEFIVVRPYETMAYINGVLAQGNRRFIQINFEPLNKCISKDLMNQLYKHLANSEDRILKVGSYFSEPHKAILKELRENTEWSHKVVVNHFEIMFVNLVRMFERTLYCSLHSQEEIKLLKEIEEYIDANLDVEISIYDLAKLSGLSENYFRVQFKKLTGLSPLKFINLKRIEAAKELLLNQHRPITEIAFELGFSSCQYFSTFFKKQTTFTPDEFRKEALKMLQSTVQKSVLAKDAAAVMDGFFEKPK